MMDQQFENMACTICGCLCDDLKLTVTNGRITRAEGSCVLSEQWFLSQESTFPPVASIEGEPASYEAALDRAAEILHAAKSPLIYGLSRSSSPGQRAATALADQIGANIDTTASVCHAHSVLAVQQVGEQTCTLGEVKNRADLVIYWGSNPAETHPRHMERYSLEPRGEFVPEGRQGRTLVVVDIKPTASSALADIFLQIEPGRDFEALWALRGLVRGQEPAPGAILGAPLEQLRDLAARMKRCKFGIAFFGLGLSRPSPVKPRGDAGAQGAGRVADEQAGHAHVEALLRLVRELNDHTRFYARRMRTHGDVTGADLLLAWQTGYPFSVNLARGYPRYNPGEYSAQNLLENGEVDACLLVGSEGASKFNAAARQKLSQLPTIALDYPTLPSFGVPTVRFTTGVYGLHLPGMAYRMDEVPLSLHSCLPSRYPGDHDVLGALSGRIARLRGEG